MRTSVMAIAGWLLATAAAVALGIFATSLIGNGITNGSVDSLGEDKVAAALASASASDQPSSPSSQTPSHSPSTSNSSHTSPVSHEKVVHSPGGSAVARCTGSTVYLTSWMAAQGYRVDDDVHRGPDTSARVKFKSDQQEYRLEISCRGGVPRSTVEADD